MKRFRAGTRGRVKPYKRRTAHIKIVLSDVKQQVRKEEDENKVRGGRSGNVTKSTENELVGSSKS